MNNARHKRKWLVLAVAFALALAVQIPLLELLRRQTSDFSLPNLTPPTHKLHARFVRHKPKKKPEKAPEKIPDGMIVSVQEPKKQKIPEKTKHLAQFDVDVKKEQKSRKRARPSRTKQRGKRSVRKPSRLQSPEARSTKPTKLARTKKEEELPKARPKERPSERGDRAVPKELARGRKPSLLLPAGDEKSEFQNLQMLSAEFKTDDALLDIDDEGDSTLLKARSFRYWDFFQRVKKRVRQNWRPAEVHRQRDPTGKIYGVKDRLTVVRIVLDGDGNVVKLGVHKKSGLDHLDREAMRALRAAAPFPNPPAGLRDKFGKITFGVGFLFELSSSGYRFFWKRM